MLKKGQIFSTDLIIGVLIFLLAIALFYFSVSSIFEDKEKPFDIEERFVFTNLETATAEYDKNPDHSQISFYNNNVIDEDKLTNFAEFTNIINNNYSFIKDILLKNIAKANLILDVCLYFENSSKHIVPVSDGDYNITGIGNRINGNMTIEGNINCGGISEFKKATPVCNESLYLHVKQFTKAVLRNSISDKTKKEIVKMNILICAKEEI